MFNVDSLKEIERRAYRSTFQDGIYDIQFGLLFLVFAWIPILETFAVSRFIGYGLLIVPILIPLLGKRFITIPRMGAVEFGPKRKSRRRLALIIAGIIFILMLPLFIMTAANGLSGRMGWMLITAFVAPVFIIGIYAMDSPRLYGYAALLFMAVIESEFLYAYIDQPLNAIICFGLPGLLIFSIGLVLLVKFIMKYPKPLPEANHAEC